MVINKCQKLIRWDLPNSQQKSFFSLSSWPVQCVALTLPAVPQLVVSILVFVLTWYLPDSLFL